MENIIIQGLIAGVFTLIGIYFKHRLENKNTTSTSSTNSRNSRKSTIPKTPKQDIKKGCGLSILGFILIIIIGSIFGSSSNSPQEPTTFQMIVSVLVLMLLFYGFWRILKGMFKFIVS